MAPSASQLAQINIARLRAPLEDPLLAGFVARLNEINMLAEQSPGFIWRLQTEQGDATQLRPWEDDLILVNMSVWESVAALQAYVYRSAHAELMRQRREWFEKFDGSYLALWWIRAGHIPTIEEAKEKLALLNERGESAAVFTFKKTFPPPDQVGDAPSIISFESCPTP